MFKIIADSCTDPVPALLGAPEFAMVPLIIRIGSQEYVDNGMLSTEDLIARMAASPEGTSTACPAPQWYMDAFEGADEVYVITLSAELSGSYNSAVQARALYLEEHPDKRCISSIPTPPPPGRAPCSSSCLSCAAPGCPLKRWWRKRTISSPI